MIRAKSPFHTPGSEKKGERTNQRHLPKRCHVPGEPNLPLKPSLCRTWEAVLPFSLFSTETTESAGWETIAQKTPAVGKGKKKRKSRYSSKTPASASQVLGLQACVTTLASTLLFKTWKLRSTHYMHECFPAYMCVYPCACFVCPHRWEKGTMSPGNRVTDALSSMTGGI